MTASYRFSAELWIAPGNGAWHFVTLPFDTADEIDERTVGVQRGFGSVRVRARVGSTTWDTSVFPDSKAKSFVLPVKKPVRMAEGLSAGDVIVVQLDVLET